MHLHSANGDSRLSRWLRVREFAVPPSMIETATARRSVGDWAGACAAARVDVDLNLRAAARTHGDELAALVRADLRHLAPDLLRWHMPRVAPDGLLRPGLTVSLARYPLARQAGSAVHLVARTPPAWAAGGQRMSLTLWDGLRSGAARGSHPHPRPDRRFRLDLHRHLWDSRRTGELGVRCGAAGQPADCGPSVDQHPPEVPGCAVDRWAAEARILLRAQGQACGAVAVRLSARHQLVLDLPADRDGHGAATEVHLVRTGPGRPSPRCRARKDARSPDVGHAWRGTTSIRDHPRPPVLPIAATSALPVLPDAATWVLPDLELLRAGWIDAERLHPLVAAALVPGRPPAAWSPAPDGAESRLLVECRGVPHRIGLVNGVLVALDHAQDEIHREELLAALTGTPLPCLQAIDEAHRHPECLVEVRERLHHGDTAGALTAVEDLLGPDVRLRSGALRDELETAARRRIAHGLFRAGLAGLGPRPTAPDRRGHDGRVHPRRAASR